jgi:hypothetical protein
MLQNGIETGDMDVTWVSSISWYFLLLFGLSSVYTLLMDDSSHASGNMDMMQMQMQSNPMAQPNEVKKVFILLCSFLLIICFVFFRCLPTKWSF